MAATGHAIIRLVLAICAVPTLFSVAQLESYTLPVPLPKADAYTLPLHLRSFADSPLAPLRTTAGVLADGSFTLSPSSCTCVPSTFDGDSHFYYITCPKDDGDVVVDFRSAEAHNRTQAILPTVYSPDGAIVQKLTFHVKPHQVRQSNVKTCGDPSLPQSCSKYTFIVRRLSGNTDPVLQSLAMSHPAQPLPPFDPHQRNIDVKLFANEPVTIAAQAPVGTFVTADPPLRESGGTDGWVIFEATPKTSDQILLYVVNEDHTSSRNYTLNVTTEKSLNPRLASIAVAAGRLEPNFRSNIFSYYIRVPDGTTSVSFEYTPINTVDTQCAVNGVDMGTGGHSYSMTLGGFFAGETSYVARVRCIAADPKYNVQYVLVVVMQKGGSTLLDNLDVVGAELNPKFEPGRTGPYVVDLGYQKKPDMRWVGIVTKPKNLKAQILIDGKPVAPANANGATVNYYRVNPGEKRTFTVGVRTDKNPIAEEYQVIVDRTCARSGACVGSFATFLGSAAAAVGSFLPGGFINNIKFLQFMSVTNRLHGNSEYFDSFTAAMHPFNAQWAPQAWREQVKVTNYPQQQQTLSQKVASSSTYTDKLTSNAMPDAVALAGMVDSIVAGLNFHTPSKPAESPVSPQMLKAMVHDELLTLWKTGLHTSLAEVKNDRTVNPDDQILAIRSLVEEATTTPQRILDSKEHQIQEKLANLLDVQYKEQQKLIDYFLFITIITTGLCVVAVSYALLWLLHLRSAKSFCQIRQDYPIWLHPSLFWTFTLDCLLIAYSQTTAGLTAYAHQGATLEYAGLTFSARMLFMFSLTMCLLCPLTFIAFACSKLFTISKSVVWSRCLGRYHDRSCVEGSARKTYLNWLPSIIRYFLTFEVSGVVPICRPTDVDGETSIIFSNDPTDDGRWCQGEPSSSGQARVASGSKRVGRGYKPLVTPTHDTLQYNQKQERVRVRVVDDSQIDENVGFCQVVGHDDAIVAYDQFKVKNAYDAPLEVDVAVQTRHLPILIQSQSDYTMWMHTDNLRLPYLHEWGGLFASSQRNNFFFWALDRSVTTLAIFVLNVWFDAGGMAQKLFFFSLCFLMMLVYIPGVISTGLFRWSKCMETEVERTAAKQKIEEKRDSVISRIWPFDDPSAQAKLRRDRGRDQRVVCGLYGYYDRAVAAPLRRIRNLSMWKTRFFLTLRAFVSGPAFLEFGKCLLLLLSMSVGFMSSGVAVMLTVLLVVVVLTLLNLDAAQAAAADCWRCCTSLFHRLTTCVMSTAEVVMDFRNIGDRIKFFSGQAIRYMVCEKNVSFMYPGTSDSRVVRDNRTCNVSLVETELGLHMSGVVKQDKETKMRMKDNCVTEDRFTLTKTLHRVGRIGAWRPEIDDPLPVRISYQQFTSKSQELTKRSISRLAATIQIVNHSHLRLPQSNIWRGNSEDDSFLSLYTDPRLVPIQGKVGLNKNHGYSVQYNRELNQLVIKGPGIKENRRYTAATGGTRAKKLNFRLQDGSETISESEASAESSLASASWRGSRNSAEGYCFEAGVLIVPCPASQRPDMHGSIRVRPASSEPFLINPQEVEVTHNKPDGEICLSSRHLMPSMDSYTVEWDVADKTMPFTGSGNAHDIGVVAVQLDQTGVDPDLKSIITLTDDRNQVLTIDPRETDAYQAILPQRSFTGATNMAYCISSRMTSFMNRVGGTSGGTRQNFPDTVPCTIIQCVDPIKGTLRVEPNFHANLRKYSAELEQNQAKLLYLQNPKSLGHLYAAIVPTTTQVRLFAEKGLEIEEENRLINPLLEVNHPRVQAKLSQVRAAEPAIRAEVERILRAEAQDLRYKIENMKEWAKAYNDSDLAAAQHKRDLMECGVCTEGETLLNIAKLRTLKTPYEFRIPGFVYPLTVEQNMVSKKCNEAAQLKKWRTEIQRWLIEEEMPASVDNTGRVKFLTQQIMSAVASTFNRAEDLSVGQFRSIAHFICDSLTARGRDVNWKPDPLCTTGAWIRVFETAEDGESPDFQKEVWLPCGLKLTANSVKIIMQNDDDMVRDFKHTYPWRMVTGYYMPLQCFEKVQVTHEPVPALAKEQMEVFGSVDTKIVFRKNQQFFVDDRHVRRSEDDLFDNQMKLLYIDQESQECTHSIMVGHCVPAHEVKQWLSTDVDPSIRSYDGKTNVHPLTFRASAAAFQKWSDIIKAAQMDKMPRELDKTFDGTVRYMPDVAPPPDLPSISDECDQTYRSATATATESAETPPSTARYDGEYVGNRYHGYGKLYDAEGKLVYDGEWESGFRWGNGTAYFKDSEDIEWKYDGRFERDEMTGQGKLTLVDSRECERLKSRSSPADRWRVVFMEGTFRQPHYLRRKRRGSEPPIAVAPNVAPNLMKGVIMEGRRGVVKGDSYDSSDGLAEIIVDTRRTHSATGDVDILGCTMGQISNNYGDHGTRYDHKPTSQTPKDSLSSSDSASSSTSDVRDIAAGEEGSTAVDLMPARTQGLRQVHPNLGYQTIHKRFVRGVVVFADGSVYKGKLVDGKPRGNGYYYNKQGVKYSGAWVNGMPHGRGVMEWQDGSSTTKYNGGFAKGLRSGQGAQSTDNGRFFLEGVWQADTLYSGKKGLIHIDPKDAVAYPLQRFSGDMDGGKMTGEAKVSWPDGSVYKGQLLDGKRHGFGSMINADGSTILVGHWENDLPHGRVARMVLPSGKMYCGECVKGARQGMGEMYTKEGGTLVYEGLWSADVPSGRGTYWSSEGEYEGEFKNGKRQGKGSFKYKDTPSSGGKQRTYVGDWNNDMQEGVGMYTNEDGQNMTYKFRNGQLLADSTKAYKPACCGKAPATGAASTKLQPTELPAEAGVHWGKNKQLDGKHTADMIGRVAGKSPWSSLMTQPFEYDGSHPTASGERLSRAPLQRPPSAKLRKPSAKKQDRSKAEVLTVVLHEAKNLHSVETFGKMDPFVHVKLGNRSKDSTVLKNAGVNPNFKDAQLKFFFNHKNPAHNKVLLEVWDKDTFGKNDLVGSAAFDIAEMVTKHQKSATRELSLLYKKQPAGTLRATFTLGPFQDDFESGSSSSSSMSLASGARQASSVISVAKEANQDTVKVEIHSAKNLYKVADVMDPIVKVSVGRNRRSTKRDRNGGINPKWNEAFAFPLDGNRKITFEVFHKDKQEVFIGAGEGSLSSNRSDEIQLYRSEEPNGPRNIKAGRLLLTYQIVK